MTYLELVNAVLERLREEPLTTTVSIDDEFAKIVALNVNDAKTKVENAWDWNALRYDWDITLVPDQVEYTLPDSSTYVKITEVSNDTRGHFLKQTTITDVKRKAFGNTVSGVSHSYTVSGANVARDVKVKFWPAPSSADSVTVTGWRNQAKLVSDDDLLLVPAIPVIYEALAMSARERGEVGGQTSLELFGMAKKYLEDATALDAALSPYDTIWEGI